MSKYHLFVEIEAGDISEAWEIAASLPRDLSPTTVTITPLGLRTFSLSEEGTGREISFSQYNEEENN